LPSLPNEKLNWAGWILVLLGAYWIVDTIVLVFQTFLIFIEGDPNHPASAVILWATFAYGPMKLIGGVALVLRKDWGFWFTLPLLGLSALAWPFTIPALFLIVAIFHARGFK